MSKPPYPPPKSRYATKPHPVSDLETRIRRHSGEHREKANRPRALFLLHRTAEIVQIVQHRRLFADLPFEPVWCFKPRAAADALARCALDDRGRDARIFDAVLVYLETAADWPRIEGLLGQGDTPVLALSAPTARHLGRKAVREGALVHLDLGQLDRPLLALTLQVLRLRRLIDSGHVQPSSKRLRTLRLKIVELKGFSRSGAPNSSFSSGFDSP